MKSSTSIIYLLFFAFTILSFSCNRDNLPNTQLGNWVQAAAIGDAPRSNASSFVIGDVAYVGLGYNESVGSLRRLKDFWKFS
ncbi:MAG TPA: hypothetical protein VN824_23275, partial [Puia sp.]|nr:hypothetical protein [Puia sp.]